MSNEILFHTQLASIMEVLANAAVEEISKLVEEGYAVLHVQMSEYQKENEDLKMRLHLMELKAARQCAEWESPPDRYSHGDVPSREKRRGTAKAAPATVAGSREPGRLGDAHLQGLCLGGPEGDQETPTTAFSLQQAKTVEAKNDGNTLILIKEETTVDYSHPCADTRIPVQDSGAGFGDGVPALGLQVSSAESSEGPAEPLGTGRGSRVWEVSGSEAVLGLQAENGGISRSERVAGRPRPRDSRGGVAYGTPGRSQPRGGGEGATGRACPSPPSSALVGDVEADFEADFKADIVVIDPVKEEALLSEWDKEPGRADIQRHLDERETGEPLHPTGLSQIWPASVEIMATMASTPDDGASDGRVAGGKSSGASSNLPAKEKRFACRFCGKSFSRQNALEIHQRVHTGEKPYRCAQCGKCFSDSSNHRRHQSVHSRERPFGCTQCQRSFSHHYQLKEHQRVHAADRPFSCAHCGKRFGERTVLKLHQQREHAATYLP